MGRLTLMILFGGMSEEHPISIKSATELAKNLDSAKYDLNNANNTVMVHIRHLREKLRDSPDRPKYIRTVWGVGYKLEK